MTQVKAIQKTLVITTISIKTLVKAIQNDITLNNISYVNTK